MSPVSELIPAPVNDHPIPLPATPNHHAILNQKKRGTVEPAPFSFQLNIY
jgi:hypothetical protein